MSNIDRKIAKASLDIGGIKLQPTDPFQWASGYFMPIYNDNRMLLDNYEHRQLITDGFVELIEKKGVKPDFIAGNMTAGIAPAAGLADRLGLPLLIMHEGEIYAFEHPLPSHNNGKVDAIASTCPWAIPYGVKTANERKLPFMYVRQSKKEHGLKQRIEGIPKKGQKVLLLDQNMGDGYSAEAVSALLKEGIDVSPVYTENITEKVKPRNVEEKTVLVIEDLISTGGSSAKPVQEYRNKGAIVPYCFAIFSYGFDKAEDMFLGHEFYDKQKTQKLKQGCEVTAILKYQILLEEARDTGYINEEQGKLLQEWREEPFEWGEKQGFPRVTK